MSTQLPIVAAKLYPSLTETQNLLTSAQEVRDHAKTHSRFYEAVEFVWDMISVTQ